MTTPVSFPIAKLLKEKGFDIPCREGWVNYLASFTGERRMPDDESNLVIDELGNSHLIERPTISDVIMWLYEKHGLWIYARTKKLVGIVKFEVEIERVENVGLWLTNNSKYYNSPLEAYEAAIEYCLTKLI